MSRGSGYTLFLTPAEFVLALSSPAGSTNAAAAVLRMRLLEASPQPELEGLQPLPGAVSYVAGADPARWLSDVASFGKVRYRAVYPGVDLIFHGDRGYLEYDFVVAPGADPDVVGMAFGGARGLGLDGNGDLVLDTEAGPVRQEKPFIYQEIGDRQHQVEGGYDLDRKGSVRFRVEGYDRTKPLIIDPALPYSTYLGGGEGDGGTSITVDASGSTYLTGWTRSADFPKQVPTQGTYAGIDAEAAADCARAREGGECGDAFVAKLKPDGSGLVYATYLGGSGSDVGYGIAVDGSGAAYVTGRTKSPDFPTKNAFRGPREQIRGVLDGSDAFVAKLDPKGSLAYSTYLDIKLRGSGRAIAVDATGKAYVTGTAGSTFPTKNPLQPGNGGRLDAFVAKVDPAAAGEDSVVYLTPLGGPGDDVGSGIAVDSAGSAYVTGTAGQGFPTKDPLQAASGGGTADAFIAKLSPDGSSSVYSTFLGGSEADDGSGIAVDLEGRAHVTGRTASPNFPTRNPFEARKKDKTDGFLAVLDPNGSALAYSSYLGGSDADGGAIALDPSGNAFVAGVTRGDLPTKDPFQVERKGPSDAFVVKLDPRKSGSRSVVYATYLGGSGDDRARGIAVDPAGSAYVTGSTDSRDGFPTVVPLRPTLGGTADGFVAKLTEAAPGAPAVTGVTPASGPASGGALVTITGTGFDSTTAVRFGQIEASGYSVASKGTKITVRAPRHADGNVMVTVATKKGTSAPSPATRFTYSDGGWARITGPARFHHTATVLADGKVLVAGGCLKGDQNGACAEPTDSAELYDPLTRTWAATGKMTTARPPQGRDAANHTNTINHTATRLADGRVLVTGGNSAEIYDPAQRTWTPTGAPARPVQHTATLLPDGKVLRIDGRGMTELYDPAAGTWATIGEAGIADRVYHTATLLPNGKVLVLGGDVAELFDPATATWTPTADPGIVRAYHTVTLLPNGKVLLVGGRNASTEPTASVEIYDPEGTADPARPEVRGAWSPARSLSVARYAHTAALLPSGKVLVAGGSYEYGSQLASAELFDPATGQWKPAGDMSVARGGSVPAGGGRGSNATRPRGGSSFTATPLPDGSLLVVGGSDAVAREGVTAGLDSAELYGSVSAGRLAANRRADGLPWPALAGGTGVVAAVALLVGWQRRRRPHRPPAESQAGGQP